MLSTIETDTTTSKIYSEVNRPAVERTTTNEQRLSINRPLTMSTEQMTLSQLIGRPQDLDFLTVTTSSQGVLSIIPISPSFISVFTQDLTKDYYAMFATARFDIKFTYELTSMMQHIGALALAMDSTNTLSTANWFNGYMGHDIDKIFKPYSNKGTPVFYWPHQIMSMGRTATYEVTVPWKYIFNSASVYTLDVGSNSNKLDVCSMTLVLGVLEKMLVGPGVVPDMTVRIRAQLVNIQQGYLTAPSDPINA